MPDLLLSLGVDDRGVATGMRGAVNKVRGVADDLSIAKGVKKGLGGVLGFSLGGGATLAGITAIKTAINEYEQSIHPAERSTDRFAATMRRALSGLGRDFSVGISPALDGLDQWIAKAEKAREATVDWLAGVMGQNDVAGVTDAQKAQQEQEKARQERDTLAKSGLDREVQLARLHGDNVRAARAEAQLFLQAQKDKYAAAVEAKKMSGAAASAELERDRTTAALMVQRAQQEDERRKERERKSWSDEMDQAAEQRRQDEEKADKEAQNTLRTTQDARLDLAGGAVDELRAKGLEEQARQLDTILDYRRRLLEIDRLEITDTQLLSDLRSGAESVMRARLAESKDKPRTPAGVLDSAMSAGAARSFGQVFGGAATSPVVQVGRDTNKILSEIKGVLQQINTKSGDAAAEYF